MECVIRPCLSAYRLTISISSDIVHCQVHSRLNEFLLHTKEWINFLCTFLSQYFCLLEGEPPNPQNLLKIVYSHMFKLQSPSKYSPFDAIHLWRHFFHCSKQFLNLSILMPFSPSATCCFTSSTSAKCFPLRNFFIWGNKQTKKLLWARVGWIGRVVHEGHAVFGQKLLNTQCGMDRCARKSHIMKWTNMLSLKKKITEAKQPLTPPPAGTLIQMGSRIFN